MKLAINLSALRLWARPLAATTALLLLLILWQVYGFLHAWWVVDQQVWQEESSRGSADVVVTMSFPPEQFNLLFLEQNGTLAKFDTRHTYLTGVSAEQVRTIGAQYWVDSVDLWWSE